MVFSVDFNPFSVLIFQLGDELQIASGQVGFDPAIDALVELRIKVVLPVARFACGERKKTKEKQSTISRCRRENSTSATFADEFAFLVDTLGPQVFLVDGRVFGETVETQVDRQTIQLLIGQRFFQEIGHFSDSALEVLRDDQKLRNGRYSFFFWHRPV